MPENELLIPQKRGYMWSVLVGTSFLLMSALWLASLDNQWMSRDSVELGYLFIVATTFNVYTSSVALARLLAAIVGSFIRKYGLKPSLIFIGCFSLLAYVIVMLADASVLKAGQLISDNVVDRLESSIVEIEEKRGPIKQRHMTGSVPYSLEEHTKYQGEDVVFDCYRLLAFDVDVIPTADQVVWEKDGRIVRPTDHVNMTWTVEKINNTADQNDNFRYYLISAKLTIIFIDRNDFGNYSCFMKDRMLEIRESKKIPPKPKPPMCPLEPPPPDMCFCIYICDLPAPPPPVARQLLQIAMEEISWKDKYNLIKVYSLVKMQVQTRIVHAPPAGLVSFSATYDNLGDIDDISFDYTIGDELFDSVCGGPLSGCSISVYLYWYLYHKGGHNYYMFGFRENVRMSTAISGTGWQCVCKGSYNYHTFRFYRNMYNKTSGRYEIWEVKYPHTIQLASRIPDLLFQNYTNKVDPFAKEPCWTRPRVTHSCKQDEEGVEWIMWLFLRLELILYILSGLISLSLAIIFLLVVRNTILIPLENKILIGRFQRCKNCFYSGRSLGCITEGNDDTIKHDVFISHAQTELPAGRELKAVLENLNLKSFLPEDDILGGQLKNEAVANAIASSRLFIVILTQTYIDSGLQNRFEFPLILKKALERTTDYKTLLILRRDDSRIPEPFEQFCSLDWRENIEPEKKIRCLQKWSEGNVQEGNICPC